MRLPVDPAKHESVRALVAEFVRVHDKVVQDIFDDRAVLVGDRLAVHCDAPWVDGLLFIRARHNEPVSCTRLCIGDGHPMEIAKYGEGFETDGEVGVCVGKVSAERFDEPPVVDFSQAAQDVQCVHVGCRHTPRSGRRRRIGWLRRRAESQRAGPPGCCRGRC